MNNKVAPYKLYVLIDTNIYFSDQYRTGAQFQALMKMLKKSHSTLLIPIVVEREVIKKFSEEVNKDFSDIEHLSKKYPKTIKLEQAKEDIISDFVSRWNNKNRWANEISVIGHDDISVDHLVERSILEKAPFGKKSKGFRDAVIWATATHHLGKQANKDPFVLITNNSADFGVGELDASLRADIESDGRKVFYYNDIGSFLKVHGSQLDFLNDELVNEWVDDNVGYLENFAEDTDSFEDLVDESHLEHPEPEDVNVIGSSYTGFSVYTYYISDEDKDWYYIDVEVEVEAELEIEYGYRADPWDREDWDDSFWRHNTEYQWTSAYTDLTFKLNKKTKEAKLM